VLDQLEVVAGRIGVARTTASAGSLYLRGWRADGGTGVNGCLLDRRSIENFGGLLRNWKLSLPIESHGFDSFRKGLRRSAANTDKLRGWTSWDLSGRKWSVVKVAVTRQGGSQSGGSWGSGGDRGGGPDRGVDPGRLDLVGRKWRVAEVGLGRRGDSQSGVNWGDGGDRGGGPLRGVEPDRLGFRDRRGGPHRGVEPGRLGVSLHGWSGRDGGGRKFIGVLHLGRDDFHFISDTRAWLE
jgi:hypothetical protein